MSTSLPERPDLDQVRRQAKELRDAAHRSDPDAVERFARHHRSGLQGSVTLAAAQLVIACELGFGSWPKLKAAIDARVANPGKLSQLFVAASVDGRIREATRIFDTAPNIARHSLEAAAVLGDAGAVRERLVVDPAAAVAIDEVRGWPPLLYACHSRWHRIDPGRAEGIAEVVRLLLDAGAAPDVNNGAVQGFRSALNGSVEVNNPHVVSVLLEAGANPDLGRPISDAAGHGDRSPVLARDLTKSHGYQQVEQPA